MKKNLLFTLLAFMVTTAVNAERISREEALQKAQQFMPDKMFRETRGFARSAGSSEEKAFYVFNADDNKGFVIVSGDDRTTDILGYSKTGNLDLEQMPDNLRWWLDGYVRQIEMDTSAKPAQKNKTRGADNWKTVNPLIKTEWNQNAPYNTKCPLIYNQYPMTGCVAVAMAQVMYYWKCPKTATPAIPEYTTSFGLMVPALPSVFFDWDLMKCTYKEAETGVSADAVATLLRYCGQAVEMDYGLDGSSAGIFPWHMVQYFGFGKNAKQLIRTMYSSSDWESMIYKEVFEGRPVIYGGSSMSGGHEFIVDGYDGNGLFHMNWGWGGMSDGYYVLSLANSDDLGIGGGTSRDGYSIDQHAIIGLQPDDGDAESPQFYAGFEAYLEKTEFSRGSNDEDFTGVSLPGYVFFQYENTDQTGVYTFETAWGLYQNGNLLKVLGVSEPNTLENNYVAYNWPSISFGSGLADGQYQFRQMYRLQGSSEWQLCQTPFDSHGSPTIVFIEAAISDNNLTLRESEKDEYSPDLTVNSISYSSSSFEVGRPVEVTVNLTNNGDSYQELIWLSCGSENTIVCGSVEAGQTGDVKLYFTPRSVGEVTLNISNYYTYNIIKTETIKVEAAKPQSLSGTMVINNFDEGKRIISGTTLKVTAQVINNGENIYDNAIVLELYKNTEDPFSMYIGGPLVKSKSVMTTIQVGETKNVDFIIEGLNPDDEYFFFIYYSSVGYQKKLLTGYPFTLTDETLKPGDVTGDGDVDKNDITAIVQLIMTGQYDEKADLNGDKKVDAADLVLLVNKIK